jgi:hypothetical protein
VGDRHPDRQREYTEKDQALSAAAHDDIIPVVTCPDFSGFRFQALAVHVCTTNSARR